MPTPTDVYSDRDSAPEMAEATETESAEDTHYEKGEGEDKSSESGTGLVSKTFFGDKELKPGTTCKVRVEKVYDDQVSISYVAHKADDSDDSEDEPKVDEDVYA